MPGPSGIPAGFIALFVIFAIVAIGGTIARFVYRSSKGLNPFFPQDQVEAKIVNSELLRPAEPASEPPTETIERKLAELDDLHDRGVITDAEWHEARAKAISST